MSHLGEHLGQGFWPLVERMVGSLDVAGVAVVVVRDDEVVARGFGVRDVGTREPVTPETMFHLASVSKPFVATAVVSLTLAGEGGVPPLDLDAPVVERLPELTLADGREGEITARGLYKKVFGTSVSLRDLRIGRRAQKIRRAGDAFLPVLGELVVAGLRGVAVDGRRHPVRREVPLADEPQ